MQTRLFVLGLSALGVVLLNTSCAPVGCDFQAGSVNGPEERCQERQGLDGPAFSGMCAGLQGEAIEGGCPEEGKVGGCVIGDLPWSKVTDWYYEPLTREDVQQRCDDDNAELVEAS